MKTRPLALVASLALLAFQPSTNTPREQRNGALKYWETWTLISPELNTKLGAIDWDAIGTNSDPAKMPASFTDAVGDAPLDSIVNGLENAASYPRCDFEVQWEDGATALLPHLSKMRSGARVCRVVSRMELSKGRTDRAAHVTALMLTQAQRAAQDPLLINSLVGIAIADSALSEVEAIVARGPLTPGAKQELLGALRKVDAKDPCNTRACVLGERDTFVPWLEKKCAGGDTGRKLHDVLVTELGMSLGSAGLSEEEVGTQLRSMDEKSLRDQLKEMDGVYAKMLEAWDKPDAVERLAAIEKSVLAGEHGLVTKLLMPTMNKAKVAQQKFSTRLAETVAAVEKAPVK